MKVTNYQKTPDFTVDQHQGLWYGTGRTITRLIRIYYVLWNELPKTERIMR